MIRAAKIGLVVMGGGLVMYGGYADHRRAERCTLARQQNLPDADQICARGSSGSSGYSSWRSGSSYSGSTYSGSSSAGTSSVSRGGFGASGAHFASAGS
jgi:hypothetical protein